MKTTTKERLVIQAIATSEYGQGPGDYVWSESIASRSGLPAPSMGGIFASLRKKGLANVQQGYEGGQSVVSLTEDGVREYVALCVAAGTKPMEDIHGIVAAIATTKGTT